MFDSLSLPILMLIFAGAAVAVWIAGVNVFGMRGFEPLTYRAASLVLVLEGALVIAVLAVVVMSTQLPSSLVFERIAPRRLLIAVLWVVGLLLLSKDRSGLIWQERGEAPKPKKSRVVTPRPRRTRRPKVGESAPDGQRPCSGRLTWSRWRQAWSWSEAATP